MRILFFSLLLLQAFIVPAQNSDVRFEHLDVSNGLPENSVVCLFRDSRGFMWVGTQSKGLCRYDGNYFKEYHHDSLQKNSIPGNFVTNIMEDKLGRLWISCFDKGVSCFDPVREKFTNYVHDSLDPNSFSGGIANGGVVDSKGRVWIACWEGGINLYDPATDDWIHFLHKKDDPTTIASNRIKDIKQDAQGYLWYSTWVSDGSKSCVQKMDPETKKIFNIPQENVVGPDGKPVSNSHGLDLIHKVMIDSKQNVWYATYLGVYRYEPAKNVFYQYVSRTNDPSGISFNNVRSLCEDDNGDIWMGSLGGGLNRYDHRTGAISIFKYDYNNSSSISDNAIRGIFKDGDGRLWIGTYSGGVNIINPLKQEFPLIENKKLAVAFFDRSNGKEISGFCVTNDSLLVVTSGAGTSIYDYHKKELVKQLPLQHYEKSENVINAVTLVALPDNTVLAGGGQAVFFIEPRKGKYGDHIDPYTGPEQKTHFFNPWRLKNKKDGNAWVLNDRTGIEIIDLQARTSTPLKPGGKMMGRSNDILEANGRIYITTPEKGFYETDAGGTFLKHYRNDSTKDCLPSDNLFFVEMVGENTWVGTETGLRVYNPSYGKFYKVPGNHAFDSLACLSVITDKNGDVWLATNESIWKYSAKNKTFTNFNRVLGFNAREVLPMPLCISPEGCIFVACSDGIVMFDPSRIVEPPSFPHVFISGIRLFNNYYSSDTANFATHFISLTHDQNSLSFEFSANDFTSVKDVDYQYMLEGYDSSWISSGSRTLAAYTNLAPGDYTFKVKCTN
ncbi:MAG TPA: two-component regulator propeller domain-containing protein, partial [Bacteroidia bacterium]